MSKVSPFHYFDGHFGTENIKIIYLPQQGQGIPVIVQNNFQVNQLSTEIESYIINLWKQQVLKFNLKNELLASVVSIDMQNGNLDVIPTEYRQWKIMAEKSFCEKFGSANIPVPLNVQSVIQTLDGQLVFGPRPGKDTLQLPGGMFNVAIDLYKTRRLNPIASAALREFREKIAPLAVFQPEFLGTSFYSGCVLTTVFVSGKIELAADDLFEYRIENKNKIKDFNDFPQVECIGNTQREIETALYTQKMHETTKVGLLLYGHKQFGPKWLQKHCPVQMMSECIKQQIMQR